MVAAPMDTDELTRRADLVITGRVLRKANGRAIIRVGKVTKGRIQRGGGWLARLWPGRLVAVKYQPELVTFTLGEWSNERAFAPGNRIRTYLGWNADLACYEAVWWNAVEVLKQRQT